MRYFFLDRILEVAAQQHAVGIKCVSLTDPVVHDHFPGYPMLPGAMLIESAAQLAGFLIEYEPGVSRPRRRAILAGIDGVKFKKPARPGDRVRVTARMAERLDIAAQVDVEAECEGDKLLKGRLTFMLRDVPYDAAHQQRNQLYELWTRDARLKEPE